jgi:hypothetical protein
MTGAPNQSLVELEGSEVEDFHQVLELLEVDM